MGSKASKKYTTNTTQMKDGSMCKVAGYIVSNISGETVLTSFAILGTKASAAPVDVIFAINTPSISIKCLLDKYIQF